MPLPFGCKNRLVARKSMYHGFEIRSQEFLVFQRQGFRRTWQPAELALLHNQNNGKQKYLCMPCSYLALLRRVTPLGFAKDSNNYA